MTEKKELKPITADSRNRGRGRRAFWVLVLGATLIAWVRRLEVLERAERH